MNTRSQTFRAECSGMTVSDAAEHMNVTHSVVYALARENPGIVVMKGHRTPRAERTLRVIEEAPALAEQGLSKAEVARRFGMTRQYLGEIVRRDLPDLRFDPPSGRKRFTAECSGMTQAEAAEHLGLAPVTVATYARRIPGITLPESRKRPPPRSKTTKKALEHAQKLAEQGMTKSQAARKLGIKAKHFNAIMKHHLPSLRWVDGRFKDSLHYCRTSAPAKGA